MKGINGPRPMSQVQGTMPFSMQAANAQHRRSLALQPGPAVQTTQLPPPADAVADEPDEPGVVHIAAAARNVLVAALGHQDPHVSNSKLPNVVNWLLESASEIPPGHVDKLLVGFLKNAIESGHGDLVQIYADTILNSPVLRQDPGRRLDLLMGLAFPVSPSDWRPAGQAHAGDAFPIRNAAAAQLADAYRVTRAYRGPPLLTRMCKGVRVRSPSAPVPQQQVAMYHGTCALFSAVLRSNELTIHEQRTFCASAFPGADGMRTAARYAMQRGNAGLVVAMMETIIDADHLPVAHQAALFDSLRVGPREVLDQLFPLANLPNQEWVKDVLPRLELTQVAPLLR